MATVNGVWQPAVRLTDDDQEEALPVLVAPEGAPTAVWSEVGPLAPGQTFEVAHQWNTTGHHFSSAFVTVYAVADSRDDVREWDETNNAYPQSVRVIPGWAPRLLGLAVETDGRVRWTIEAPDATTADLIVESAASLGTQVAWSPETEAEITALGEGRFAVKLPARGDMRFYRVRIAP